MPSDAVLRGLFLRTQQYAVPLHSCRAVAHAVIQSLRCGMVIIACPLMRSVHDAEMERLWDGYSS